MALHKWGRIGYSVTSFFGYRKPLMVIDRAGLVVLLFLPVSLSTLGQADFVGHENHRIVHLSVEDGLPHDNVQCIRQDRNGIL